MKNTKPRANRIPANADRAGYWKQRAAATKADPVKHEQEKARLRKYYAANREKKLAQTKAWASAHPDYQQAYHRAHYVSKRKVRSHE
tara:strand:+ start:114 stop:374 length:261 start_codon:yes stop_codon:yes gene_type:complete